MIIEPEQYESQLDALARDIGTRTAKHVNSAAELARVRAVVQTWFHSLRGRAEAQGLRHADIDAVDAPLRQCMELTTQRSTRAKYKTLIRQASRAFKRHVLVPMSTATTAPPSESVDAVRRLLATVAPGLAVCYQQVLADLSDSRRLSYRGPANELREILREVLDRLAPDAQVMKQPWYEPVDERNKPTQRQRARFILERRKAGSKQETVAFTGLTVVEEGLSRLVRDMYDRTSVAAHTPQDATELSRLLRYFDALIHELCGP